MSGDPGLAGVRRLLATDVLTQVKKPLRALTFSLSSREPVAIAPSSLFVLVLVLESETKAAESMMKSPTPHPLLKL
jgi:hypothetical protein